VVEKVGTSEPFWTSPLVAAAMTIAGEEPRRQWPSELVGGGGDLVAALISHPL
jgi:hypothetical protein